MFKVVNGLCKMSIRCPPEVLLRSSIDNKFGLSVQLASNSNSSHIAAVCTELGKPLQIKHVPTPTSLKKGEILLKVNAAGLNFADVLICAGLYQEKPPLPFVPGSEMSGRVVAVGDGVSHIAVNDNVLALNQEAFAEYCVSNSALVWKLPDCADPAQAASLLISYGTAYMALQHTAQVKPGETVLVTAAAGALGLAIVELASQVFGCKTIGACGGKEKGDLVLSKGADFVIDYTKDSVKDKVKEITKGKGANVILDAVGGDVFKDCLRSVAFEGRIVTLGYASGDIPKVPANILLVKSCSVRGVYFGSYAQRNPKVFHECAAAVVELFKQGKITPHVSRSFPLQQTNEALQFLQSRKSTGKVVIEM